MTDTAAMLEQLKALAQDLSAERAAKVVDARDRVRAIAAEGYESRLGLALVSAELAVGEEMHGKAQDAR